MSLINDNNLQQYITQGVSWDDVPKNIKSLIGGSKEVYENTIKKYSFEKELSYDESPCKNLLQKKNYYQELIAHDKLKLKVIIFL
jgi:uncharacterized protein YeeX (DUF496 family)